MSKGFHIRIFVLCLALVAGLSSLSWRLISLQWDSRKERSTTSPGRSVERPLLAQSGYIVDRNEEVIARDNPVTTIIVDKNNLNRASVVAAGVAYARVVFDEDWATADEARRDQIIMSQRNQILASYRKEEIVEQHLAYLVNILTPYLDRYEHREELLQKIGKVGHGETILAKEIPEEIADKIQEAVKENRIQCLRFEKNYRRIYPNPELAAHVVGVVNYKGEGVAGIEESMSTYLRGKDGFEITKRDSRNLPLGKTSGVVKPPIKGLDVQLSLDLGIQEIVEQELDAGMFFSKALKGAVIVMDPRTGEILAMASRPTFDLNKRINYNDASTNYAIESVYEPGSTFKAVTTSAALEEGLATLGTQVFCHNGKSNEVQPPLVDYASFGWLSMSEVLAKSSNIGTFQFAKMLGKDRLHHYIDLFGFGKASGIALRGEVRGRTPKNDNLRDFASRSYGYAVNVTPLQIANAYCAIANGGRLMKPLLVKSVILSNGQRLQEFQPEIVNQVMSPENAREMRRALATVTEPGGTATKAAVPGFSVAGKTGTSWKYVDGDYRKDLKFTSFVGMLPAEKPEFVCVVLIDQPTTSEITHSGGTIAAPVFSKIATRIATAFNLKPTRPLTGQPLAHQ